mgnify:CR=1 FL=1
MGLGGYLAWTAVAREIVKEGRELFEASEVIKIYPYEARGEDARFVESEVFKNNPYFWSDQEKEKSLQLFPLQLNNPHTNYCLQDTPSKAIHVTDKHMIEHFCSFYEIKNPELRCEMYFAEEEKEKVGKLKVNLSDNFLIIEPISKTNYTPNRVYPFEKWQAVVDEISKEIEVVQIGTPGSKQLQNVTSLIGQTTFREASCLMGEASLFISSEGGLVHAATAVDTTAVVVITGYQSPKMVAYPQNINIDISSHGPCGLKVSCPECSRDAESHDYREIIKEIRDFLNSEV